MTEITVTKNDAGQRADRFLTKAYPNLSLPLICKLMRKKRIKLNGARTEPNVKLSEGDVFRFYLSDELLDTLAFGRRVVLAVTFQKVDNAPDTKTCAKRDNQSLQYTNCAVEKLHINLAFCRCAAQKKLLKMKMPPLFLGGCVLVGQIYFVYVKGFIGLYDCRTGRHIPFHVKSVSFVEVGKVFVVRVFRDVVFVA